MRSSIFTTTANCLFCPDVLEFLVAPKKIVRVGLWGDFARVWLLNEVLIALLFRELDRILPRLENQVCALHEVR